MKKKINRKTWIIQRLRRMSLKWPPRNRAKNEGRREYYKTKKDGTLYNKPNYEYQCESCKKWFPDNKIELDHIYPVVDPNDITEYSEAEVIGNFAVSLLCYEDGYQRLCRRCHQEKTEKENVLRQEIKKTLTTTKNSSKLKKK